MSEFSKKISKQKIDKKMKIELDDLKFTKISDFKNIKKLEFFIEDFLPKHCIVGFYGKQGSGKSIFLNGLCQKLLGEYKELKIMFFDAENSMEILKSRGIESIFSNFNDRFFFLSKDNKPREFLKTIIKSKRDLSDFIIILDSFRDFYPYGYDMNTDKCIDLVFDDLKIIRDRSMGVFFIHHVTKVSKDESGVLIPKGSGAMADNSDYLIQTKRVQLKDKAILLFEITEYGKGRGGFKPKAFEIPQSDEIMQRELLNGEMILKECDFSEFCAFDDENTTFLKEALCEVLASSPVKQYELRRGLKRITKLGDNAIYSFISNYAKYFCDIDIGEKNAKIYTLKQN